MSKKEIPFKKLKSIILKSNLFDKVFYLRTYRDARQANETPLDHFIKVGLPKNRKPNQYFDPVWYKEHYQDVQEDGGYPFIHYILYGLKENRKPNPNFDPIWYREYYKDVKEDGAYPFVHYVLYGSKENRKTKQDQIIPIKIKKLETQKKVILNSVPIDLQAYLEANEDVADAISKSLIKDAKEHFVKYGKEEVRQGKRILYKNLPYYGEDEYLAQRLDVQEAINAGNYIGTLFDHYLEFGAKELLNGLENQPPKSEVVLVEVVAEPENTILIELDGYLEANADVADAVKQGSIGSAEEHFIKYGKEEVRLGKRILYKNLPYYNESEYLAQRPDVQEAIDAGNYAGSLFDHYLEFGAKELLETLSVVEVVKGTVLEPYDSWSNVNQLTPNRLKYLLSNLENISVKPLISVVVPVYNPPLKYLQKAIDSVVNQIYTNWEICIVDDCSTNTFVKPYLENLSRKYANINIAYNKKNTHISEATNRAVEMAKGDYLVFLDQDDLLELDAFAEIALYVNKHPNAEVIYSDDDKIDTEGKKFAPQFKPDWSPEYLLSFMYCGHLKCVKKSLYVGLGGFRKGFEGSQDFDFFLRAAEKAKEVGHIPRVLYHWRVIPGSTAAGGNEKNYSFEAGINAVQETLDRQHIQAEAYQPKWAMENGAGIYAIKFPDEGKSVAIIIPTKNGYDLLKRCIDSLKKTTYENYKVYIIDNDSDDEKTLQYLKTLRECEILKISSPESGFSYSYVNNEAVKCVKEELVLFLNNDTEVINPQWLSQMVGYLQFEGVGSVGARLLFPNDTIQHAGILHGITHGFPITSNRNAPEWDWGYLASAVTSKNFTAVTAACMLTPRALFESMGGFDDKDFSVAFNDCDYGYRLYNSGYRNVLAPEALLYHYEGASRGHGDKPIEESAYIRKYGKWKDPYYNPNLALNCANYAVDAKSVVLHDIPKFRVLMVTHNLNLEGAPKSFYEMAKGLKRLGLIEPVVVSHVDGPLLKLYEEKGIEVKIIDNFNLFSLDSIEAVEAFLDRQIELISSLNVDVIYGNTIELFWAMQCAKKLDLPSIWNIRESEEPFSSYDHNPIIKQLMIESLRYPYRVVFVADATKNVYEYLNTQHNFMTIYNGFDEELAKEKTKDLNRVKARDMLNVAENEVCILVLGTVCERKGQKDLVYAVQQLKDSYMGNVKVYIVGDRKTLEYSVEMHQLIAELPQHKRDKIVVVDETMDIYKYYMASDIFVCSSRVESFPKVIQEAMYYELAIITTPVYGIVEQVKDNVSALYYQPANIEELTRNLEKLLTDDRLRNKLAQNAKIALDILPTTQEMSMAYEEVFKEAWLSGKSR